MRDAMLHTDVSNIRPYDGEKHFLSTQLTQCLLFVCVKGGGDARETEGFKSMQCYILECDTAEWFSRIFI
jgi:hypothetical protein